MPIPKPEDFFPVGTTLTERRRGGPSLVRVVRHTRTQMVLERAGGQWNVRWDGAAWRLIGADPYDTTTYTPTTDADMAEIRACRDAQRVVAVVNKRLYQGGFGDIKIDAALVADLVDVLKRHNLWEKT